MSREFLTVLEKAKAGESHRNPGATDATVLRLGLELLIAQQGKRKASVPARVKREVVARDEGKCQWQLPGGSICGATARLEVDHVVPRGKGGPDTVENSRILCRSHNLEAARRAYGDEVMDLFTQGTHGTVVGEEAAAYGPDLAAWGRPRPGAAALAPCLPTGRRTPEPVSIPTACAASSDSSPVPTAPPRSRSAAPRTRCGPSRTCIRTAGASPGTAPAVPASGAASWRPTPTADSCRPAGALAPTSCWPTCVTPASGGWRSRTPIPSSRGAGSSPTTAPWPATRSRARCGTRCSPRSPPRVASACAARPTASAASRSSSRLDLRAGRGRATLADVRTAMAETVALVCAIADRGELRSTLNFLVSDGRLLCACRHGKPLHVARSAGRRAALRGGQRAHRPGRLGPRPRGRASWAGRSLRVLSAPLGLSAVSEPTGPAGARARAPARRAAPRPRR